MYPADIGTSEKRHRTAPALPVRKRRPHFPAILILLAAATFAFLPFAVSLASAQEAARPSAASDDLLTYFYKDPRPERLDGFMDRFSSTTGGNWQAYPPVAGFLAAVLLREPSAIDRLVQSQPDALAAETLIAALRMSGASKRTDELRSRLRASNKTW